MVTIIAHRGARSIAPENTIAAAKQALKAGADLWETDIAVTCDEHLILFHDHSLQRTTDVTAVFPDRQHQVSTRFTLAEIRRLNPGAHFIKHDPFGEIEKGTIRQEVLASFKKEKIPTLEEALIFTKEKRWKVNLELKILTENFKDFPLAERVIEMIRTLQMDPGQLIVSSYNHSWLKQVNAMEPSIEIQVLMDSFEPERLDRDDFSFSSYNIQAALTDKRQVDRARIRKKKINLFTVNEKDEMIKFINMGVNGLFTDYPQRLASIVNVQ